MRWTCITYGTYAIFPVQHWAVWISLECLYPGELWNTQRKTDKTNLSNRTYLKLYQPIHVTLASIS